MAHRNSTTRRSYICTVCGVTFPPRANAIRCVPCQTDYRKNRHKLKPGYGAPRYCLDCDVEIVGRGKGATRCIPCADTRVKRQRYEGAKRYKESNRDKVNARWRELDVIRRQDPEFLERRRKQGRDTQRRRRADPKKRAQINARQRERMASPEYRERKNARARELRLERKDELNARHRERMRTDPDYRERKRRTGRETSRRASQDPVRRERRNARERERRATDPEYRERDLVKQRLRHRWDETVTKESVVMVLESQNGLCMVCESDIRDGYHMDHIFPRAKGGSNGIDNLQLLCRRCNLSKLDKLAYFPPDGGQGRLALGV